MNKSTGTTGWNVVIIFIKLIKSTHPDRFKNIVERTEGKVKWLKGKLL